MTQVNGLDLSNVSSGGLPQGWLSANEILGKDDFLNLLVVQLQNQDPLEPLQDTEFIAQLAQFSSVEQLKNINDGIAANAQLDYLLSQTISNTLATQLIGKYVKASGNSIELSSGDKAVLSFDLGGDASTVKIKIYDSNGSLVRTLEQKDLEAGFHEITWDGENSDGVDLASGLYTFSVAAENSEGEAIKATTMIAGRVDGVSYDNNTAYLIIDGRKILFSNILEICQSEERSPSGNGS